MLSASPSAEEMHAIADKLTASCKGLFVQPRGGITSVRALDVPQC